jgi:4-hydroxy-3-methylbut-2-en-1-yl diphosphate synthase IspG/GcpE
MGDEEKKISPVCDEVSQPENVGYLGLSKDEAYAEGMRSRKASFVRDSSRVVAELSFERKELCEKIQNLTKAIKVNPENVSFEQKELWRLQHEAMIAYKKALDKRITNIINESENDYALDEEPEKE